MNSNMTPIQLTIKKSGLLSLQRCLIMALSTLASGTHKAERTAEVFKCGSMDHYMKGIGQMTKLTVEVV
jgi:hypothetical protein